MENDLAKAVRIDPLEEVIDDLCDTLKSHHIDRVSRQECTLENGFVFNDLLTDYERISDHCSNVAIDLMEAADEALQSHEFQDSMEYRQSEVFLSNYNRYKEEYAL